MEVVQSFGMPLVNCHMRIIVLAASVDFQLCVKSDSTLITNISS